MTDHEKTMENLAKEKELIIQKEIEEIQRAYKEDLELEPLTLSSTEALERARQQL